jgi:uncharacterized repeat protein (TIGR03803 family)
VVRGGKLFGATYGGGLPSPDGWGYGTVFKFDLSSGAETVIYRFTNSVNGDANPPAGLTLHNNLLYGTTRGGGGNDCSLYGCAVVFSVAPQTGVQTVLEDLDAGRDGAAPSGALIFHDGYLYGVSAAGGEYGFGIIFKIDPKTNAETVLYNFTGGADGGGPNGKLVYHAGAFYGITAGGGTAGWGTVYKLVP